MLHTVKALHDFTVGATDGEIGEVKDVYFDDERCAIRYMVVATGKWLSGRKVLVSPIAVRDVTWDDAVLNVKLTQQQVRQSMSHAHIENVARTLRRPLAVGHVPSFRVASPEGYYGSMRPRGAYTQVAVWANEIEYV